jgi:Omp85 superfamily domain
VFESEYDTEEAKEQAKEDSIKREAFSKSGLIKVKGPYKYKKLFSVDQVTTSLMIDPLRGFGILLDGQMSDLLEQNRFNLGLFVINDFANSNMYGEYMILKHRLDYKFRFDRQAYLARGTDLVHKYTLNKFIVGISYPLNPHHRISIIPFIAHTRFSDVSDPATIIFVSDVNNVYTGAKAEWVYDFTRYYGLNMKAGNMAKVSFERYFHAENSKKNLGELVVDIRHYQPIHKALLLAVRMSYGQFVGESPKQYLLGGMDNWLVNSTDTENPNSPLITERGEDNSDILFHKYTMNMRGFKYNAQFGQRHLLFNAELRFPIAQYLYRGTIGSAFLRNLQLIAFTDMGSAWNGTSPFSTDNSLNKQVINEPPFRAVITNYRNPFLMSYGGGIRSLLIGYYMKLDVAWGVQNNIVKDPMVHFTFGHDF